MKANELMIGDFVRIKDVTVRVKEISARIERCCFEDKYGSYWAFGSYWPKEVEPVPLTKEMLFANGFNKYVSCRGKTYYGYTTDHKILFEIMEWVEGNLETAVGGRYIELKYVHELQHLLRLAGLGKVADEFKVK